MVRQTEIRIAPEITGRLTEIAVKTGQPVHKGDLLATLDNPELAASVGEAKAALAAARADRDQRLRRHARGRGRDPGQERADGRGEPDTGAAGDRPHHRARGARLRQPAGAR